MKTQNRSFVVLFFFILLLTSCNNSEESIDESNGALRFTQEARGQAAVERELGKSEREEHVD